MTRWACMAAAVCQVTAVAAAGGGSGALVPETPLTGEHLVAAPLPAELFAAADAAFGNVWVEDESGARVPALVEPVTEQVPGGAVLAEYPVCARDAGVADGWQMIDLASGGVPLNRLTLRTGDTLFSRAYTLHGLAPREGGGVDETPLAAGTLAQIDFQGVAATNLTVAFAPRRFEVYRLRLAAANGATTAVVVARAEGPAWQAVVPMRPGKRYTLRVGDDPPPDDGGRATVAALRAAGAATAAGRIDSFSMASGRAAPLLGRTHLLFIAMLTAGGVLLWALLRAAKRMR